MKFTNPGIFLDLPLDKLVRALFGRSPPHAGQDRIYSLQVPFDHDMQEPYGRRWVECEFLNSKSAAQEPLTWDMGENQFQVLFLEKKVRKVQPTKASHATPKGLSLYF